MVELYVAGSAAALSCGEVLGIDGESRREVIGGELSPPPATFDNLEIFYPRILPGSRQSAAITVPMLQGEARALLNAALAVGGVVNLVIGWNDGVAVPTVSDGNFVVPTTRSFITIKALLANVTERLTDVGTVSTVHIADDRTAYLAGGPITHPGLGFTKHYKA